MSTLGVSPIVISGSLDGTLRVWDLDLQQPIAYSFHRRGKTLRPFANLSHFFIFSNYAGITCVVTSIDEPMLIVSGDESGEVSYLCGKI